MVGDAVSAGTIQARAACSADLGPSACVLLDLAPVAVGCEVASGLTDEVVVPQCGGEGEQSERDAGGEAFVGAAAVAFDARLMSPRQPPSAAPKTESTI